MTSFLVESLNLTLTANELNANEWTHFLSKMGKSFILKAIISLKSDDIKHATSRMKQMIQSRDEIPSNALAKAECIDQLSSGIIGEIGSYLNAKDYGRFEQCNRFLYVSCNSPNKVQELRPSSSTTMKRFKLCKYSSVRRLYCWNMDVRKLKIPSAMNSVTELRFDHKSGGFMSSDFIEFLSKFPSAESLNVYHLKIGGINHDQSMMKMLPPNITELRLCAHQFMGEIIKFYANQVEKMWFPYVTVLNVKENNLHFPALFYLNIGWRELGDRLAIEHILSNAPKLKHIRLELDYIGNRTANWSMLFAHKALEMIETEISWHSFESFCDAFESVCAQYQSTSIERIEVSFDLHPHEDGNKREILRVIDDGLEKLFDALQSKEIDFFIDFREELPLFQEEIAGDISDEDIAEITKKYNSKIFVSYFDESVHY